MAGDILIIDSVATNRIVLKVKLLAAQYRVRPCASLDEARQEIEASLPDLILMDTGHNRGEILTLCKELKANAHTSVIPIVATGGFATPSDRVAALQAGADDVLTKPFDDHILQARIRSLLRARDARLELRMREDTRAALGFAEASQSFVAPSRVVLATDDATYAATLAKFEALKASMSNVQLEQATLNALIDDQFNEAGVDLFVLDFSRRLDDDTVMFRMLSELRSRSATRHAGVLVILPADARKAAAMALDLGASDIVCSPVDLEEIRHRCAVLVQAKVEADTLRRTVENGLEAAITDPLTGLFNRRYALPHLSRLSAESSKSGRQFAIMVLDLDHFKAVNDTFGHKAGDEILQQVAQRLRGNVRAVDLLARIGGEEFLVAIPNSDVVHARAAAERLCRLIGGAPFFVGPERQEVSMTMSVGVSLNDGREMTDMVESLSDLVNEADVALYEAKLGGRNKVSLSAA